MIFPDIDKKKKNSLNVVETKTQTKIEENIYKLVNILTDDVTRSIAYLAQGQDVSECMVSLKKQNTSSKYRGHVNYMLPFNVCPR